MALEFFKTLNLFFNKCAWHTVITLTHLKITKSLYAATKFPLVMRHPRTSSLLCIFSAFKKIKRIRHFYSILTSNKLMNLPVTFFLLKFICANARTRFLRHARNGRNRTIAWRLVNWWNDTAGALADYVVWCFVHLLYTFYMHHLLEFGMLLKRIRHPATVYLAARSMKVS